MVNPRLIRNDNAARAGGGPTSRVTQQPFRARAGQVTACPDGSAADGPRRSKLSRASLKRGSLATRWADRRRPIKGGNITLLSRKKVPVLRKKSPCCADRTGVPRPRSADVRDAPARHRRPIGAVPVMLSGGVKIVGQSRASVLHLFFFGTAPNDLPHDALALALALARAALPARVRQPAGGRAFVRLAPLAPARGNSPEAQKVTVFRSFSPTS